MKNKDFPIQLLLGFPDEAIERTLEACKKIATTPSRKIPRKKAELKRLAIRKAAACMSKHPIKRDNASVRSTLVGLSTILWVVTVSEKGTQRKDGYGLMNVGSKDDIQGTDRAFPESFLASSVIFCERECEMGLLRG